MGLKNKIKHNCWFYFFKKEEKLFTNEKNVN